MSLWWAVGALTVALVISVKRYMGWTWYVPTCPNPIYVYDACPYCENEVSRLPPDAIDWCAECDLIVEGETIEIMTIE